MRHVEVCCPSLCKLTLSVDFFWQPLIAELADIEYSAVDIVPSLIKSHTEKYADKKNWHFYHWDMSRDKLPFEKFDLIMTRDMIQHNSLEDGLKIVRNVEQSGAKYFLTNFHANPKENTNIKPGQYYPINPMLPPFNFPTPLMYIMEGGKENSGMGVHVKYMALFEIKDGKLIGQGDGKYMEPDSDSVYKIVQRK
jgi:hypothetical protein